MGIGLSMLAEIGLALAVLIVFLAGLKRGRFVGGPLYLGLFALGFGLLGTVINMIDCSTIMASKAGGNLADLAEGISKALVTTFLGLITAIVGGLFTWILHARANYLERRAVNEEEGSESK